MNKQAEQHLDAAEGFFARGDEFYAKAADEIIAAQEADPTLSQREIGERFGKSYRWVGLLVAWRTSGKPDSPIDWQRGSHATKAEIREGIEKLPAAEKVKIVQAALADEEVATEVMTDTSTRLHADAAAERVRNANRGQSRSEAAARNRPRQVSQDEYDAATITALWLVAGDITQAWTRFARAWAEAFPRLSEEAQEAALGIINIEVAQSAAIESSMRGGDDLDAALDEILNQGA